MTLVSGNIRHVRILAGLLLAGASNESGVVVLLSTESTKKKKITHLIKYMYSTDSDAKLNHGGCKGTAGLLRFTCQLNWYACVCADIHKSFL